MIRFQTYPFLNCRQEVVYEGDFLVYWWLGIYHLVETVDFEPESIASVASVHVITEGQNDL